MLSSAARSVPARFAGVSGLGRSYIACSSGEDVEGSRARAVSRRASWCSQGAGRRRAQVAVVGALVEVAEQAARDRSGAQLYRTGGLIHSSHAVKVQSSTAVGQRWFPPTNWRSVRERKPEHRAPTRTSIGFAMRSSDDANLVRVC